jgi:DNA-binding IclR family transcriptional regulator
MTLKAATELRLFDLFPASQQKLTESTTMAPDRLLRFLRALGELGVIQLDGNRYVLTSAHPETNNRLIFRQ